MARTRSKRITLWLTPAEYAAALDASHAAGVPACRHVGIVLKRSLIRSAARLTLRRWSSALVPADPRQGRLFNPPAPPKDDHANQKQPTPTQDVDRQRMAETPRIRPAAYISKGIRSIIRHP